jgi:hypothetical protein
MMTTGWVVCVPASSIFPLEPSHPAFVSIPGGMNLPPSRKVLNCLLDKEKNFSASFR